MAAPCEWFIGVMSGTSLDGIDVALVAIEEPFSWSVKAFTSQTFPASMRKEILAGLEDPVWHLDQVCAAHAVLGQWFGEAVRQFLNDHGMDAAAIRAVGLHGLTVRHCPEDLNVFGHPGRGTLQLGDPFVVRRICDIPVVFDFRSADMAAGGQGAPLASFLDRLLFHRPGSCRVLLNLGGIANLTFLPVGEEPVIAFDTGPANMVIDALMMRHPHAPQAFDPGGRYAARGTVIPALLARCLRHPYFQLAPPKSTGRELFGDSFLTEMMAAQGDLPFEDLVATATELTAVTVAMAVRQHVQGQAGSMAVPELIVSGGGAHNTFLLERLGHHLPGSKVHSTVAYGLDPDAKEALLMAVLAWAHLHRIPSNIPSVTGASEPVVLGASIP